MIRLRILVLVVIAAGFLLPDSDTLATAQRGDILIVDGEELSIQTNPLEPFLEMNPELRPESEIISTSLWRGYVATWEIAEGQLMLVGIEALRRKPGVEKLETEFHSVMAKVFPGHDQVFAEWFTGHMILPRGELLEYVHMGYASTFDGYTIVTIVDGLQRGERSLSAKQFRKFRKAQFRRYRRTAEYAAAFEQLKEDDDTRAKIREFLFEVDSPRYMSILFEPDGER